MDWFVSGSLYETPGSEMHYSERLYCLKEVGTLAYYYRPQLRIEADRARYGLPPAGEANVYVCPQTLFKFHPEFDAILGRILEEDPDALVVLVVSKIPWWTLLLRERLSSHVPEEAMQRVRFVAQQAQQEFLGLIACSDVMLDTIHFNGMNSSLEGFAMGTPVVTWPREFQRGRHTAGMYRRMGIDALIADSAEAYVRLAVKLGRDRAWRRQMHDLILERNHVLYEDASVVRQFEQFFIDALEERRCAGADDGNQRHGKP
jgi:predicted O-linked N-acetylglucosamine transferase (SPINDLY family)